MALDIELTYHCVSTGVTASAVWYHRGIGSSRYGIIVHHRASSISYDQFCIIDFRINNFVVFPRFSCSTDFVVENTGIQCHFCRLLVTPTVTSSSFLFLEGRTR